MPPPCKVIYWDSCIFIAWIMDEQRPNGEMSGIYECVQEVEARRTRLITSVMTRTEVFEANLPPDVKERYARLLNRRNVLVLDQDLRVSVIARGIREYYQDAEDRLPGLSTPDAVHLATAIHYKADAFYTFDDGKRGSRSLLSLNGNVAGHSLMICKPRFTQYRFL